MAKKITAVAKQNLTINQNGKTLHILKGDSFTLYGMIFAFKQVIVDITAIQDCFDITVEQVEPAIPTYRLTRGIVIKTGATFVNLPAGTVFSTVSDITYVKGAVLRLANYTDCIEVVEQVSNVNQVPEPEPEQPAPELEPEQPAPEPEPEQPAPEPEPEQPAPEPEPEQPAPEPEPEQPAPEPEPEQPAPEPEPEQPAPEPEPEQPAPEPEPEQPAPAEGE